MADAGLAIARSWMYKREIPYKPHLIVKDMLEDQYTLGVDYLNMESHTPMFLNMSRQVDFTSSDVRGG